MKNLGSGKTIFTTWMLEEAIKEAINRKNINDKMFIPEGETRQRIGNSRSNNCNYFERLVNEYPGIMVIVLGEIENPKVHK